MFSPATVGSSPCSIKHLEATVVMIWLYILELSLKNLESKDTFYYLFTIYFKANLLLFIQLILKSPILKYSGSVTFVFVL